MLRAQLFGGLVVSVDGRRAADVPGLKPRSLLAYLLLNPGPHPRSRLAGRFWPDVLDASARASLRSALWTVRVALEEAGGGSWLVGDRAAAGLSAELPREIDAERFARLVAAGDRASLEEAVAVGGRPLLPDLVDEWALEAQDAHRDRLVGVLERLAALAEAEGDRERAVAWTREALRHDRLREATHRALMRRLAAAGERGGALAAYRRCRDALAELGVPPSAETRRLALEMRGDEAGGARAPEADAPRPRPPGAPGGPPLVGRRAELAELAAAWARARAGRGGVVAVGGEAGIGKSRLAAELAALAARDGGRRASGTALDLDAAPPFAPWLEALRDLARTTPAPPPGASWAGDLARLSPAVAAAWGVDARPRAGAPELERAALFEAVAEGVAWCARGAPLALVLEDLHRADPASLALLGYLGATLRETAALVVVTHRSAAEGPGLERALAALRRRGAVRAELVLGPLGAEELVELAARAAPGLDPGALERVVALADGNPLLAREAARAAARGVEPSEGLRPAVRSALDGLDAATRDLVELAAAAGRPLRGDEAEALVGEAALEPALAAAAAAGLLERDEEGRVRFAHDLLRRACAAGLSPERGRRLHARLADALAGRGRGASAQVGHHLVRSGQGGRGRAHLVAAAAEARALGALDEAAGLLREAASVEDGAGAAAAEVLMALAEVESLRGDRAGLDAAFAAARDRLREAGDALGLASAHAQRAHWLRTRICIPRESLAGYREALDLLDLARLDAPEVRLLAMAGAAWAETVAGDPARAERLIAEVEARPEAAGDPELRAELALDRTMALIRAGRAMEAEALGERAAGMAEAAGRLDLKAAAFLNIAAAAASRGDFARALELMERMPDRDVGPSMEAQRRAGRAYALSRLERHDEAVAAASAALTLTERRGHDRLEAVAGFDLGSVLLAAGRPAEAAEHLAAALESPHPGFSRPLTRLRLAEAALAAGDAARAREEAGRFPFEPLAPGDAPGALLGWLERLQGLIALAGGDPAEGLRRLAVAEAEWRALMAGARAEDAYVAALTDLGRVPVAGLLEPGLELGRTLADRAAALAAAGRGGEARAAAEEALALADAVGFTGYRARLAGLLAPAGRR